MKPTIFFITGTDTGVGKTVLTALLTSHLREGGVKAVALKPVCSGGRADVRALGAAMSGALKPGEINPWHFRAPISPLFAARRENRRVKLQDVLAHIRAVREHFEVVLVEGAGGLLSPLGEKFASRELIAALRATPLVVCPNRLGAVNQVLLTFEALPRGARTKARIVLMSPPKPDLASRTNAGLLAEFLPLETIFTLPWLDGQFDAQQALGDAQVRRSLSALMK